MRKARVWCAVGLASSILVGVSGAARAEGGSGAIVVRYEDANFKPIDPAHPDLVQIAVLRGDPDKGPNSMLMKMQKYQGVMHYHSADYELVVVEGRMKHWLEGQSEEKTPVLGSGSYWYQPKMQHHADSCLSDVCVMFISWSGKRDAFPAPPK